MNAPLNPAVALSEPEIEGVLLGSLICYPEALAALGAELNPQWFVDSGARLLVDAILRLHRDGHRISPALLVANIPASADAEGRTRAQLVASVTAMGMPLSHLGGYMATLRDRWARRELSAQAEVLKLAAASANADPFTSSAQCIGALDALSSAVETRQAGTLADATDALFRKLAEPDQVAPTTGLRKVDAVIGGYYGGQLVIIGGRPSMGKSAYACSSLRRTAEAGNGVAFFSLEMGREEIAARCLSDAMDNSRAPFFGQILRNQFGAGDTGAIAEARAAFTALPFYIDAAPRLNFSQVASRARKAKARFEAQGKRLAVVCIDHMGLVEPSDRYAGNKVAETGEISRAGKALAKELGCCVLLLCQLNRAVEGREDKRPSLADLRWSGDIEQDADVVGFLYREAYYLQQEADADPEALRRATHKLDLLIRKNRNGECRDVSLWCSIGHSAIRD